MQKQTKIKKNYKIPQNPKIILTLFPTKIYEHCELHWIFNLQTRNYNYSTLHCKLLFRLVHR